MRYFWKLIYLTLFSLVPYIFYTLPFSATEVEKAQTVLNNKERKAEADRLLELGNQLFTSSRYQEAMQAWQRVLQIYRAINDRNGEAISINNLGNAYYRLGQYEKAIVYLQQSLEIFKQIGDRNGEADSINNLGNAYNNIGQYEKAIAYLRQSLEISKLIGDRNGEANSINNLGNAYRNLGQYEKAITYYQQSLDIKKQIGDRNGEAISINNLGYTYNNIGQYEKAIVYLQQSLDIKKQIGDRNGEAISIIGLGNAYNNIGQYKKSIAYLQQSLEIFKQIGDRNGEADSIIALGYAYKNLGKYEEAIVYLQQSLDIRKQIGNRDGEANSILGLGIIYDNIGQYEKAITYYQQSLDIKKQIGDRNGEAISINNLGNAYYRLGKYEKAIIYYQQSLKIFKQIGDRNGEADSIIGLGYAYNNIGQYEKAIAYLQQSLDIKKQISNRDGEANSIIGLGYAYYRLGKYEKAIIYYQQSLNIKKQIGDREGEGITLSNMGLAFNQLKQPEIAILFYKQSVNIREAIRKDIRGLSKDEQKSYLSTIEKDYRTLADLLLKQDRILEAQQVLDLLKIQELSDYLKTVRGNDQTAEGVDLQRPEQNIIALANELSQLQQQDREGKLDANGQQRLAQLVQSEKEQNQQFNAFLNSPQIKKLINELRRSEDSQNIDIAKYRKLQKDVLAQMPHAVLLYPLILEDRLEIILLNANTTPLRRTVNIKREDLNTLIFSLLSNLRHSSSNAQDIQDTKIATQKAYDILIKPFANELQQLQIDTIIYAPDGQLRYIPLAALYDGKQWLAEKYRINNITAESLTSFNSKAIHNPRILAGAFGTKSSAGFSSLPATITEVKKIAALFPNTTSLLENAFTKSVTETKANSHTILHLATHGFLSVGNPEESFILFGNGDKATIREIQDWSLKNVDLVVLSACQTGLGKKLGTGIEILGLGYQMQSAGARAAIASLWTVNDDGTQALMNAFYTELQKGNVSVTEALRRAQVSLIKSGKFNHPYFWSAFFAIGNGL